MFGGTSTQLYMLCMAVMGSTPNNQKQSSIIEETAD